MSGIHLQSITIPLCSLALLLGCGAPPAYGNSTCNADNQTVYPTANGAVGVCMPTNDVVYLLCARELGLLAVDTNRETGIDVSADAADEVSAKVNLKLKQSLAEKYAAEGELATARAAAIRHCITRAGGVVTVPDAKGPLPAPMAAAIPSAVPASAASP